MRCLLTVVASAVVLCATAAAQIKPPTSDQQLAHVHYVAGWEKLKAEAFDEAAAEFSAAVRLDAGMQLAYYGLGRAEMGRKRFPDAARAYESCRDIYVRQAGQKFSGQFDAQRMRQDQALELQQAITALNRGGRGGTQTQIVNRHLQNELMRVQQSTDRGRNVTFEEEVPSFVSLALGSAYFRGERFADAEREYRAAIATDPKSGEAHNNLAVVYLTTDRLDEAEREAKAAEKAGFNVNPNLKNDIKKKKNGS